MADNFGIREEIKRLKKLITKCNKTAVPNHTFIKTLDAGDRNGHILQGKNKYWLCLRRNDEVTYNNQDGFLFGYNRDTLEEIEMLVTEMFKLNKKHPPMCKQIINVCVVEPLVNESDYWIWKIRNSDILHIKSGIIFPVCLPKTNIMNLFDLTAYNLHCIIHNGAIIKDFVLNSKRKDGASWEQVIGKPLIKAKTVTQDGWGCSTYKDYVPYKNFIIQKGVATLQISHTRDVSGCINIHPNIVSEFFFTGGAGLCGGWKLLTE